MSIPVKVGDCDGLHEKAHPVLSRRETLGNADNSAAAEDTKLFRERSTNFDTKQLRRQHWLSTMSRYVGRCVDSNKHCER